MSFHNLSISVLKVGRQLAGSSAVAAFFYAFIATIATGCLKEEDPVIPTRSGDVITRTVEMTPQYRYQIFYNLAQDSIVQRNQKWDWDLAFEATANGTIVRLNSAKYMLSSQLPTEDFAAVRDTNGFFRNRRWEATNTPDTLTLGSALNNKKVYWIDRGYDENGDQMPFVKLQFESVDNQKYRFKIARIGQLDAPEVYEITKDPSVNYVHFSFNTNQKVKVEPIKENWDIEFTQYMFTFFDPYTPYLVTGVLLNPNQTTAAVDSTTGFNKIDRAFAQNMKLTAQSDAIGYTWKGFSLDNQAYKINSHYTYVIKNSKGIYYKLRFISFFDAFGRRGYPQFEYQKL
ncbi:MAG: HmuY family protein [Saprospiraceae bacterium]|nr:HmuY family protein [Saprospiraceae bacterium]